MAPLHRLVLPALFLAAAALHAQPDLVVTTITTPASSVAVGTTHRPTIIVDNLSSALPVPFLSVVRIINDTGGVVFGPDINEHPGGVTPPFPRTLQAQSTWIAALPGTYTVEAWVDGEVEANRANDTLRSSIVVVPPLLSRQQALAIVDTGVIARRPNPTGLAAYLLDGRGGDSTLAAGTKVMPWDSSFSVTLPSRSYLFWIDEHPGDYFLNDALFVLVDAANGALDFRSAQSWPVVDGVEYPPIVMGPNLVRGNLIPPGILLSAYTMVPTTNRDAWGLVIVGQNQKTWDSTALKADAEHIKEMLNGMPTGPRIHRDNIRVVGADSSIGATMQQVCDAIDSLKAASERCSKLYVYYVGHGSNNGMALRRGDGNSSERMPYKELACKLIELDARELCIVMMACSSGASIDDFSDEKKGSKSEGYRRLKGSIVTSSPPSNPTTGHPNGSPFVNGMYLCSRDTLADLDNDRKVSPLEALVWARERNDTIRDNGARAGFFGDGRSRELPAPQTASLPNNKLPNDGGGTLRGEVVKIYYDIGLADKQKNDTVACYRALYLINPSNSVRQPSRDIEVVCFRRVKVGKKVEVREHVLARLRARLGPMERRCIATLPDSCDGFSIRETNRTRRRDDEVRLASLADAPAVSSLGLTGLYSPGEFVYAGFPITADSGDVATASIIGAPLWNLTLARTSMRVDPRLGTQYVILNGLVPDTATTGGSVDVMVTYAASSDTTFHRLGAWLHDSLEMPIRAGFVRSRGALDHYGDAIVAGGEARLLEDIVRMNGVARFEVESDGALLLDHTIVGTDSGSSYSTSIGGAIDWRESVVSGSSNGLVLDGARGSVVGGGIFLGGDGLTLRGALDSLSVRFLQIDQVAGDGIVFDGSSGSLVRDVVIGETGGAQVSARNGALGEVRDGDFDPSRVEVDASSTLTRSWTNYVIVTNGSGDPLAGASVEIRDAEGAVVGSSITDASGFTDPFVVVEWVESGGGRETMGPFELRVTRGGVDTTLAYDPARAAYLEVALQGVSSVPREPMRRLDLKPTIADEWLEITLPEGERGTLVISGVDGRELTASEVEGRVRIDLRSFAAGAYWCRLGTGWSGRFVVVR